MLYVVIDKKGGNNEDENKKNINILLSKKLKCVYSYNLISKKSNMGHYLITK